MKTIRFLSVLALASFSLLGALAGCRPRLLVSQEAPPGRAVGAACAFDDQCASGRCSADAAEGTCGACVELRALGESCNGPNQGCSTSAVCEDGVCRSTKKGLGEECGLEAKGGDRGDCDDTLYCAQVDDDNWQSGVCTEYVPVGGDCGDSQSRCVRGATCNEAQQCAIPVPVPDSCNAWSPCGESFYCGEDLKCHPGTLMEGAPCGVVGGEIVPDACVPGLVCGSLEFPNGGGGPETVSTCVPLPKAGEPCIHETCGEGLFCYRPLDDSGDLPSCQPPRGEGEACINGGYYDIRCAAGLECRNATCQVACQ